MKRACPSLVESSGSTGSARPFQFYQPWCLTVDKLLGKSTNNILIQILSGRIQAGLGLHLAHYDFRRARGIPRYTPTM
jgi:hypothetical protein